MLKSLIGKSRKAIDEAGVETVLMLAFVAQFAAHALPLHGVDGVGARLFSDGVDIVETGTVVQMPASPNGGRAQRAVVERTMKGSGRSSVSVVSKASRPAAAVGARLRRPDPVVDEPGAEALGQVRAADAAVRITIIGPDGEPRTKIVRLSGSREGMAAPARRPHD